MFKLKTNNSKPKDWSRIPLIIHNQMCHYEYMIPDAGLDTNGCPLGNSKFILLSDNLNICLWLSACQVEKICQIGLISES